MCEGAADPIIEAEELRLAGELVAVLNTKPLA